MAAIQDVYTKPSRRPLQDISNQASPVRRQRQGTPLKTTECPAAAVRKKTAKFQSGWSSQIELKFLWFPLGSALWTLEVNHENQNLIPIFQANKNWTILFIKDFSDTWRPGLKYEARLTPNSELDAVAQGLFMSVPSLHSCIVLEGIGFLWLNRLSEEPFIRCNWLEDPSASTRILPPLNLCFDLDDTLIFNAPVRGTKVPLEYVVRDPPNMLVEDVDPSGEVCSSDCPFVRPLVSQFLELVTPFFRNIRLATFSVQARAKEIAEHLDQHHMTLLKNYRPDPITGQKPVANIVFARELLLLQGHVLNAAERQHIKAGAVFWLKSLEMLDLPQKGLLQRSIILDDRVDVWVANNQENIVRITGPEQPGNIGDPHYLNGIDGGEIGQRMLLGLINLELKSTNSKAFRPGVTNMPLCPKRRMEVPHPARMLVRYAAQPQVTPQAVVACTPRYTVSVSPPTKTPRPSMVAGFSHAREKEQRERETLREKTVTCP